MIAIKTHSLVAWALVLGLMAIPTASSAGDPVASPPIPSGHFWAVASADLARPVAQDRALTELRELYRREEQALADYRAVGEVRVYEPQATGTLWALQMAMARREQALGLAAEAWSLPEDTVAVDPADYPRVQSVAAALERAPLPAGALRGLPVFLAPLRSPQTEARAVSYGSPWMDESVLLFAGVDSDAVLHEIGHVVERQVVAGLPGLAEYQRSRAAGRPAGLTDWADKPSENFAEDFRVVAGSVGRHRGNWGAPAPAQRSRLLALLGEGRGPAPAPEFALTDGLALRHWQPLTGLSFATDQAVVKLMAAPGAPAFHAKLCGPSGCIAADGRAPLSLPLPAAGSYTLTVSAAGEPWLDATVSRVAEAAALSPYPEGGPVGRCAAAPAGDLSASALLRTMAAQDGWGVFPMPPDPGLLGNGWDRDPAGPLLRWARLTGAVDPLFAWRYQPGDHVPRELAESLSCVTAHAKWPPGVPAAIPNALPYTVSRPATAA
ncbi:MAG: hypothetical protein JWN15_3962 [Firmicutes bacterium]|nr:hypothetical protein [Bacillota bacterium]